MTYTYDPSKIRLYGKDQMRFELGDTATEGSEKSCALCDEEYEAFLQDFPLLTQEKNWLQAKLGLVQAILHKFAFQVDTKIDVLEYDFSSRVAQWEKICAELEEELEELDSKSAVPVLTGCKESSYFKTGMMSGESFYCKNTRKSGRW